MDDDKIVIKNLKLEFITKKKDNYNNEQVYFKIKEKNVESKFTIIDKDGHNVPYFKSKDGKYLLKVKSKYVKLSDELDKDMVYICDAELKYYKMNDIEGYYVTKLC
jgi:hypothetical protein